MLSYIAGMTRRKTLPSSSLKVILRQDRSQRSQRVAHPNPIFYALIDFPWVDLRYPASSSVCSHRLKASRYPFTIVVGAAPSSTWCVSLGLTQISAAIQMFATRRDDWKQDKHFTDGSIDKRYMQPVLVWDSIIKVLYTQEKIAISWERC